MSATSASRDLPATQGFVQDQIQDLKTELNQRLDDHDTRFDSIDQTLKSHGQTLKSHHEEFRAIDHRFDRLESQFKGLNAKFDNLASDVSQIAIVAEEQNSRNRVVLEGLSQLWSKQAATERRLDIVENKLVWVDR